MRAAIERSASRPHGGLDVYITPTTRLRRVTPTQREALARLIVRLQQAEESEVPGVGRVSSTTIPVNMVP
jgi:hypothetical protein